MKSTSKENLPKVSKTMAARAKYAERFKNGYTTCTEFADGSQKLERFSGDAKKIDEKFIPAPPSEEIRILIPINAMKQIRKKASTLGETDESFIRKTLLDQVAPKKSPSAPKMKSQSSPVKARTKKIASSKQGSLK